MQPWGVRANWSTHLAQTTRADQRKDLHRSTMSLRSKSRTTRTQHRPQRQGRLLPLDDDY